jgi:hypothetical protein
MHNTHSRVAVATRSSYVGSLTLMAGLLAMCLGSACMPPEAGDPAGLPVALVADAGADVTIDQGDSVTLDGGATGGVAPYSFAWLPATDLSDPAITQPVASPSETTTYELTVTDAGGASATDEVTVTVVANSPPIADAGDDLTAVDEDADGTEDVALDGSGSSDADGSIASYRWLLDGEEIAVGVSPTVSLGVGTRVITLEVTDDAGGVGTDDVRITIDSATNQAPVADAGANRTIVDDDGNGEATVTLNGSGSDDPDGTFLAYRWIENGVVIAAGVTANVTLSVGTHTILLEVTDDSAVVSTDTVVITVTGKLAANAGADQAVPVTGVDGGSVTLNGSATGGTGAYTFRWFHNTAQIATGASATITLPVGTNTVELRVLDDRGTPEVTDTVDVTVWIPSQAAAALPARSPCGPLAAGCTTGDPVAEIDVDPLPTQTRVEKDLEVVDRTGDIVPDKIVIEGSGGAELIPLLGIVINDDGNPNDVFEWSQDGVVFSTDQNPMVTFQPGRHLINLKIVEVRDPGVDEVEVNKQLTLIVNLDPAEVCADAGDPQTITAGVPEVVLDGSATGGDGNYSYSWTPDTFLDDPNIAAPTASPIDTTDYVLTVTDGQGKSDVSRVTVTVE